MQITSNISLKTLNTFGIEALAKYFTEIQSPDNIIELLNTKEYKNNAHFILGGGSNLLLTRDVDALVIKNNLKGCKKGET